jgi:hypothetical protein
MLAAPAPARSQGKIGLKGGLNMFRPYGDDMPDVSYYYGFAVGGFYSYRINDVFLIQPELHYSVKGGKEDDDGEESVLKLGYIDIPVLFKFDLPVEGKSWAPNIYAGPYIAFLLGADIDGYDVKDFFNSTDLGLVVGGGLDFNLSEGRRLLSFDLRYSIGFSKIYDSDYEDIEAFNHGFQFLLGYGFSM